MSGDNSKYIPQKHGTWERLRKKHKDEGIKTRMLFITTLFQDLRPGSFKILKEKICKNG